MSVDCPQIRIHDQAGFLIVRDGVVVCFFLRASNKELGPTVAATLAEYRRLVGRSGVGWYTAEDGNLARLTQSAYQQIAERIGGRRRGPFCTVILEESDEDLGACRFEYKAIDADESGAGSLPDEVSAVCFWFPTEMLADGGADAIRSFAVESAQQLPFVSGNAGLAFRYQPLSDEIEVFRQIGELCFRYPGMDVLRLGPTTADLGTRVRGAYWLTFLGNPVLSRMGGLAGLRSRLQYRGTRVDAVDPGGAVVTLGDTPAAGDLEAGQRLPAYRELARALKNHLHVPKINPYPFEREKMERWVTRFLSRDGGAQAR